MENEKVEIWSSKKKVLPYLIASLLFVLGSLEFILSPTKYAGGMYWSLSPSGVHTLGIIGAIFFGLGMIVFLLPFFERRPRLLINSWGIECTFMGGFFRYKITWNNIKKFSMLNLDTQGRYRIRKSRFLIIEMKDAATYIKAREAALKMKIKHPNLKYGNRIAIPLIFLSLPAARILPALLEAQKKYSETNLLD